MSIESLFSESDLAQIRETISRVEQSSAGEIVPYLVDRIDGYAEALWRAAVLGALTLALVAGASYPFVGFRGATEVPWITLPPLVGAGLGVALARLPRISRWLLADQDIDRRVQLRAEAAFLEEEVFATEARTGILLFLAVFEQRAVVLADTGIHRQVPPGTWEEVVEGMVSSVRAGRAVDAICGAIERCGEILTNHGVARKPDDENELTDRLRIRRY